VGGYANTVGDSLAGTRRASSRRLGASPTPTEQVQDAASRFPVIVASARRSAILAAVGFLYDAR
jgi:hypothetical protein